MSKILVFGDSIVYGKWDSEGGWVARLRKHIDKIYNIPTPSNFQVYNCGIPGDVVVRLEKRLQHELSSRIEKAEKTNEKNLVILAIGINDSCPNNWMTGAATTPDVFKQAIRNCIEIIRNENCEALCIGLTPVDPDKSKGLLFSEENVREYNTYLDEVCNEKSVKMISLFNELKEEGYVKNLIDVVHPGDQGHEMLFQKIFSFLSKEGFLKYLTS